MQLRITLYGPPDDPFVFPALAPVVNALYPNKFTKVTEYLGRDFIDRACEPMGIEYPTVTDTNRMTEGINMCLDILFNDGDGEFDTVLLVDEDGFEVGKFRA